MVHVSDARLFGGDFGGRSSWDRTNACMMVLKYLYYELERYPRATRPPHQRTASASACTKAKPCTIHANGARIQITFAVKTTIFADVEAPMS